MIVWLESLRRFWVWSMIVRIDMDSAEIGNNKQLIYQFLQI